MESAIILLVVIFLGGYGILTVLYKLILKELAFLLLRLRHKKIWSYLGEPKAFELKENFQLLEYLNASRGEMDEIKRNDFVLTAIIYIIFIIDDFLNKIFLFTIILSALFVIFLAYLKHE